MRLRIAFAVALFAAGEPIRADDSQANRAFLELAAELAHCKRVGDRNACIDSFPVRGRAHLHVVRESNVWALACGRALHLPDRMQRSYTGSRCPKVISATRLRLACRSHGRFRSNPLDTDEAAVGD